MADRTQTKSAQLNRTVSEVGGKLRELGYKSLADELERRVREGMSLRSIVSKVKGALIRHHFYSLVNRLEHDLKESET